MNPKDCMRSVEEMKLLEEIARLRAQLARARELMKLAEGVFANGLDNEHECNALWSQISDFLAPSETSPAEHVTLPRGVVEKVGHALDLLSQVAVAENALKLLRQHTGGGNG